MNRKQQRSRPQPHVATKPKKLVAKSSKRSCKTTTTQFRRTQRNRAAPVLSTTTTTSLRNTTMLTQIATSTIWTAPQAGIRPSSRQFSRLNGTAPCHMRKSMFSTSPQDRDVTIPIGCSDPKVFEAFELLSKGLKPMLSNNPYTITTEYDVYELDLGNDQGVYHWERDPNEDFTLKRNPQATKPIIYMSSPISGNIYKYHFDSKRLQQWVSVDDEHYMVELLTRELLKKCYGYPDF